MSKFSNYGKRTILSFLFFSLLPALSSMGGSPDSCGAFIQGETEGYTIDVQ